MNLLIEKFPFSACSADKIYNLNGLTVHAAFFGNINIPEDLTNAN